MISIEPYNAEWPRIFRDVAAKLRGAMSVQLRSPSWPQDRSRMWWWVPGAVVAGWLIAMPAVPAGAAVAARVEAPASNPEDAFLDILALLAYVALALLFSFLCSVTEAVILSVTPSYIEGLKAKRPRRAELLRQVKQENLDQALAAILTLNTIAHTLGAIGAGAKAAVVLGSEWFGLFSAGMTLLILFLSEIVPKTIGAVYWPKLTGPAVSFVRILIWVLYPAVWISERLTRVIAQGKSVHPFSRDEFIAMARVGEHTGHLPEEESRVLRNLFRFESIKVADVMTPRTVISAFPEDLSVSDALERLAAVPFSRLPLHREDLDDISGFVLKADVLTFGARGRGEEKLKSLSRDLLAVPQSLSLSAALERLLKERRHIALVVDEHGGTQGLVTLEDVVETLMGVEIMDETDSVEDMRALARKRWVERP